MTNIVIDLETIPDQTPGALEEFRKHVTPPASYKKADSIESWLDLNADAVAEENWRKTSFDGGKGHIVAASISSTDGKQKETLFRPLNGSEFGLVQSLVDGIQSMSHGKEVFFIGHNVTFDLQFLYRRCIVLGINPGFKLPFNGWHGKDYFCTMQSWCSRGGRISMDNLCQILDIPGKGEGIDGSQVWDYIKAGKVEEVAEYCEADVERALAMYNRINFI